MQYQRYKQDLETHDLDAIVLCLTNAFHDGNLYMQTIFKLKRF